jgi:two-component system, OmpR family, phosphate regulon response regulator PhoB
MLTMPPTILIVEDEPDLATALVYNLEREGYGVRHCTEGSAALEAARSDGTLRLALIDVMLPDISGLEVCRQIRADGRTKSLPVIMLTARGEEIDRVLGFESGADDYVVKPFSMRELLMRVRAMLRRGAPSEPVDPPVTFGCLTVDTGAHVVTVEGAPVRLTALEFRLLTTFLERRGRLQSRETLLAHVWGIEGNINTRTVDVHVMRLREKLGAAGEYIETIRGAGYRFRTRPGDVQSEME